MRYNWFCYSYKIVMGKPCNRVTGKSALLCYLLVTVYWYKDTATGKCTMVLFVYKLLVHQAIVDYLLLSSAL